MYLSADQILGADDLKSEDVSVPEWGGTVRVRGMSGAARDKFESSMLKDSMDGINKDKALDNYRARLAALCLIDGEGKRLFRSEAETKRLGEKSAEALSRVAEVATRLSGLGSEDVKELTGN
jgi:hypothetical protein